MAHILYFGRFSTIADNGAMTLPDYVKNTQDLVQWLTDTVTGFAEIWQQPGTSLVINKTFVREKVDLKDSDEIAFLSALSGG